MTRIVQCLSHSIESYDQLKLYTELGIEAVDIGGYIDPRNPHDLKRPAIPNAPFVPEIKTAIDALGTTDNLGAAQKDIPDVVLDWLGDDGVLIFHHRLERLRNQWKRIKDWMDGASSRRVVWRTVGQSVENDEREMTPFRKGGLQIVRYSPKEENIPSYCGADAVIRFYKDETEWNGWRGETSQVINFTQNLYQRHPYTNYGFWHEATMGLPNCTYGPGSKEIGGMGETTLEDMKNALRSNRVYLYTGTQPASYTLGLIEVMMTGIPVVSIGPSWMNVFPYGPLLFEGHEIVANDRWSNSPGFARNMLKALLGDSGLAKFHGDAQRKRAIDLFGKGKIKAEWKAFLA